MHFNILNYSATIVQYTSFLSYSGRLMPPGLIALTVNIPVGTPELFLSL